MTQKIFYTLITTLLLISCENQSDQKTSDMTAQKKDSVHFKSGYTDVNELKMYYEIYGEGKPLVLIHGGGSTIQTSFGRIIPGLASDRQVIAVELQSHGRTADIDRAETFEQDADDVAGLLKNLKIENADFFGFSNGGNTTMQIAIRHPELVHKIVVASSFFKREGMLPNFFEFMKNVSFKDMPQPLKDEYLKVAPDTSALIKMFEKDKNRMVGFTDWKAADIQSIKVPALILSSDRDVVRPEHTVEMYRLFPQGQLAIFHGAHGEYMGEVTTKQDSNFIEATVLLIKKFLDEPTTSK